jgi:hypothetical protein
MEKIITADQLIIGSEQGPHVTIYPDGMNFAYGTGARFRARLGWFGGGPMLTFFDLQHQDRLSLGVGRDGTPFLHLNDGNGTTRLRGYVDMCGKAFFTFANGASADRLELTVDPDCDEPSVIFSDQTGQRRVALRLTEDNELILETYRADGSRTERTLT